MLSINTTPNDGNPSTLVVVSASPRRGLASFRCASCGQTHTRPAAIAHRAAPCPLDGAASGIAYSVIVMSPQPKQRRIHQSLAA